MLTGDEKGRLQTSSNQAKNPLKHPITCNDDGCGSTMATAICRDIFASRRVIPGALLRAFATLLDVCFWDHFRYLLGHSRTPLGHVVELLLASRALPKEHKN